MIDMVMCCVERGVQNDNKFFNDRVGLLGDGKVRTSGGGLPTD